MSTPPRQLFTLEDADHVDDAPPGSPARFATFDWTHGLIASIAFASAVVAYVTVRVWFVPVDAAAVVPATVSINSQPAGAELLIDGQPRGKTPLTFSMTPGQHTLLVRAGLAERAVKVTLGSG